MPRFDDLHAFAARAGDLVGGLVFDVANAWFVGEDPAAAMIAAGGAIELVHVSDTGRDRYAHAPIGAGDVPWRDVGVAYAALGHAPPVVAEIVSARPRDDLPGTFVRLREFGWTPGTRSPARAA
jgi:sugar phosphate isomerase/epimerase